MSVEKINIKEGDTPSFAAAANIADRSPQLLASFDG